MRIKRFILTAAGGLLAVAVAVTALMGHTNPAAAAVSCPNPCTVDPRPDLVVQQFDVTVNRDASLKLSAIVENAGLTNALPFTTKIFVNGTYVFGMDFALGAGQSKLVGPYSAYGYCSSANPVTVKVVVDYNDHVDESHENNNSQTKYIWC